MILLAGCDRAPFFEESSRTLTPHQQYAESLREAGLDGTALGRDWLAAGERALRLPTDATLPLRETGFFAAEEAEAVGYRVRARRGERLTAQVDVEASEPVRFFVDLFALPEDTAGLPEQLASTDSTTRTLESEPSRDGEFVLRLQPELLRTARYTLTVRSYPALAFPVEGRSSGAIGSFFGAERDGGRRQHHGVDIFASRGTPALAAADGWITRVSTTPRGGRVVWLRDGTRGQNLYYAHLDSQTVAPGARVRVGDTLGLVGNTGNARTTPPHLHFGIYRRGEGPIDPLVWIREARDEPPQLSADTARLGSWIRVSAGELPLRIAPSADAEAADELPRHTPLRVLAAAGAWYRVRLPDGRTGYVAARSVESATAPLRRARLAQGEPVRDRPLPGALLIDTVGAESTVPVLGRFAGFLLVEAPGGRFGWVMEE